MKDQFNTASLAKLAKSDLEALLANYTAMLHSAHDESHRSNIRSKIVAVQTALSLK